MMNTRVLLFLLISSTSLAQRGCPSEGCDSRGFNCQADFQVNSSSKARIAWKLDIGKDVVIDDVKTLGCVGNDANVICKSWKDGRKGYVSVDAMTGKARWYDTLLTNPRLPIMNLQGNIVATDGKYMEMRWNNGSIVGKPMHFLGYINDTSTIHYVEDPNLFFFVSYQSGGIYMYDMSGMCVAATFLDVKDPVTNKTVSVWKPISKLVVNTGLSTPCTYFIAQNNVTMKYRIYAVNFNHQPPYLLEKWHIDISPDSQDKSDILESRLLAKEYSLVVAMGPNRPSVLVISDEGDKPKVIATLDSCTTGLASFGYPNAHQRRLERREDESIIWLSSLNENGEAIIRGWNVFTGNNSFKYTINLSQTYGFALSAITSEIMVFGYHIEDMVLVFAYTGIHFSDESQTEANESGNYLMALKPQPGGGEGAFDTLWSLPIGDGGSVVGQIIGVNDSMLVATVYGDEGNYIMGVKLGN